MSDRKLIDERHTTRSGGVIRVEAWQDTRLKEVTRYNLAYINLQLCDEDNGRVLGFDNSHIYPGFPDRHHSHWMGQPHYNPRFTTFDAVLEEFQECLGRLKAAHPKEY
jgi:hypothetical protein